MKKMLLAVLMAGVATGAQAQVIEAQAKKAGLKQCLSAVKNLGAALLENRPHAPPRCGWSTQNPDKGIFSCDLEVEWNNGTSEFVTFSVTPTAGGQCMGDYTRVNPYPENCRTVRAQLDRMDIETKQKNIVRLGQSGSGISLYLIERGEGCTTVKRELLVDLK